MKMLARDISPGAKDLRASEIKELEEKLSDYFGEKSEDGFLDKHTVAIIRRILESRRIMNLEEYTILNDYSKDMIEGDVFFHFDGLIQKILLDYEKSKQWLNDDV